MTAPARPISLSLFTRDLDLFDVTRVEVLRGPQGPVKVGMNGFVTATYQYVGTRYTQADDLADGFGTLDMTQFEDEGGQVIGGPLTQSTFTFDPLLPAYEMINVRVGVRRPIWEIALFVNNLTDERALLSLDRERGALEALKALARAGRE